ncbi:MAG: Fe-S metabolism protein SufE [Pseudomonas sp.]|uniref:SufE family protein n=1 Tax=Pseudomonas sp. TaxID=306 RepID=UPI000CA972B7|nr:SufE family protein [Pseudomonas sp.]PJI51011.1 MAG: Fe-S metabolism protein SufE [Pseudomonas sp.]
MNLPAAAAESLQTFTALQGWEQRARLLMQWGERLEPLSEAELGDEQRVQGCESNVWLVADQRDGRWHFRAYSDARLLRGLLALLLVRVDGLPADELAAIDLPGWFEQLGLGRQLSPSRSNGLNAVLKRMQDLLTV